MNTGLVKSDDKMVRLNGGITLRGPGGQLIQSIDRIEEGKTQQTAIQSGMGVRRDPANRLACGSCEPERRVWRSITAIGPAALKLVKVARGRPTKHFQPIKRESK